MLHDKGLCNYIPLLYHEMPGYYDNLDSDVFMVKVAPMNRSGYFNFGPSCSISKATANRAKKVVVEVNTSVPYCYGGYNESIHISEVDYIVESDNKPLISLPSAPISEEEDQDRQTHHERNS